MASRGLFNAGAYRRMHPERLVFMAGRVAKAMKQASREATILLHALTLDQHLEAVSEIDDQVFCFYDMHALGCMGSMDLNRLNR
jgi:hypothetical protein